MKSKLYIFFLLLLIFVMEAKAELRIDCNIPLSAIFRKDSTKQTLSYIGSALDTKIATCSTFELELANSGKINIANVYAIRFYLESTQNQNILISFYSSGKWSKEITLASTKSKGYNLLSLPVFANTNGVELSQITKIKLSFTSNIESKIDEIEFLYEEEIPTEEPKGLITKRLKEVEGDFKNQKEKESEQAAIRDRKSLNLR